MTESARAILPATTLRAAARLMQSQDCAMLPVAENGRLIGMVSDRDIALRAVAESRDPDTCTVGEIIAVGIKYSFDDESIEELARTLSAIHIRRLAVIDRDKRLVGIVSLADLATRTDALAATPAVRSATERPKRPLSAAAAKRASPSR